MSIQVQTQALSLDQLNAGLQAGDASVGGVVTFVGYVRDLNLGEAVHSLFLEHYPGMTERSLQRIVEQAQARWPLNRVSLVHRVGLLQVGEPIVFVGVASAHRQAAFELAPSSWITSRPAPRSGSAKSLRPANAGSMAARATGRRPNVGVWNVELMPLTEA